MDSPLRRWFACLFRACTATVRSVGVHLSIFRIFPSSPLLARQTYSHTYTHTHIHTGPRRVRQPPVEQGRVVERDHSHSPAGELHLLAAEQDAKTGQASSPLLLLLLLSSLLLMLLLPSLRFFPVLSVVRDASVGSGGASRAVPRKYAKSPVQDATWSCISCRWSPPRDACRTRMPFSCC